MTEKSQSESSKRGQAPTGPPEAVDAMAQLQRAGFGSMVGMGTAYLEALSDMSAELLDFMACRIKEDVKTQHEILHCKDMGELQHIQARFLQKAIDQYQAETGKLVEMGRAAFGADPHETST